MEPEWERDIKFPEEWDFCFRSGGGAGGGRGVVDGSSGGDGVNGSGWISGVGDSGESIAYMSSGAGLCKSG